MTSTECGWVGAELTGPEREKYRLDHRKDWRHCTNSKTPLGLYACPCEGCGEMCPGYLITPPTPQIARLTWSYGVTTVPSRRDHVLRRTLASLKAAGFDSPRLFVDGDRHGDSWGNEFELEVTTRYPAVKTYGNFLLGLMELYLRNPSADRYAMFQDDFVTYRNLQRYLETQIYPIKSYLNLYTAFSNQIIAPDATGFYPSNQMGKGAVALIFDREALQTLLTSSHMIERPQSRERANPGRPEAVSWEIGHKNLDGGIAQAMKNAGFTEYCHNPSLTQHTGERSTMHNNVHAQAESFRGEAFDAMSLLTEPVPENTRRGAALVFKERT